MNVSDRNDSAINSTSSSAVDFLGWIDVFKRNSDDFFLCLNGSIVLFMQAGFAFLEAGSIRSKNVTNILLKNVVDICLGILSFWAVGYALAFGKGNSIMGTEYFFTIGLPNEEYSTVFFQSTFAATTATIVSGAVAERINFSAYIVYTLLLTAFVYPICTHWCWTSEGWLSALGFYDFSGSGVVHMAGGITALVAVWIIGPRIGRFDEKSVSSPMKSHSTPLMALGSFIIFFGFIAFNVGSQLSISNTGDGEKISRLALSTIISGCVGGLISLIYSRIFGARKWNLSKTINGSIAGMASTCAGLDGYTPAVACLVAFIGCLAYLILSALITNLKLDDPIDAVAVHGGGGFVGLIFGPLFRSDGLFFGARDNKFLWNVVGAGGIIAWYVTASLIIFGSLRFFGILRVSPELEIRGMDDLKHNEPSYIFDPVIKSTTACEETEKESDKVYSNKRYSTTKVQPINNGISYIT